MDRIQFHVSPDRKRLVVILDSERPMVVSTAEEIEAKKALHRVAEEITYQEMSDYISHSHDPIGALEQLGQQHHQSENLYLSLEKGKPMINRLWTIVHALAEDLGISRVKPGDSDRVKREDLPFH